MADLEKTISIIFSGKDDVSKTIANINTGLGKVSQIAGSIVDPLAKVADGVLAVDSALAVLVGSGLAYATAKSFEFESATVNLSKILGEQKDQIGVATDAALELSNQYGRTSVSVLESATDFKRAGFDIKESLTLTEDAIGLVIGAAEAELGVAEATEIIIATLKGFKAPASEAARLTDILNTVSNEYATNVTELGIGMANLSPIAAKMGFSFEETAGILTPVIEIFRSGDEASTALRTGLLKLVDDAKPVKDGLAALGISQRDANGHLRSGKDILFDVAKAFETAEQDEKLFLASQLVGIRQAAKMVEVFDGLRYSTEITGRALDSAGSISREVADKLATGEVAVERFKVGFQNLAVVVGDQFREASKSAIDGGTAIENAMQKLTADKQFKPIFDSIDDLGDKLGTFLTEIAKALPEAFESVNFDDLVNSLGGLGDEFKDFFNDLDLTKPEDLSEAIQFVIDSVTSLVNVTSGMAEAFQPVVDGIINFAKGFNALDESAQKGAGNVLGAAKAVSDAGALVLGAIVAIGSSAEAVERTFEIVGGSIKAVWNTLEVAFTTVAYYAVEFAQKYNEAMAAVTWGDLSAGFEASANGLKNLMEGMRVESAVDMGEALDGVAMAIGNVKSEAETTKIDLKQTPDTTELIDWSKDPEIRKLIIPEVDPVSEQKIKDITPDTKVTKIVPEIDKEAQKRYEAELDRGLEMFKEKADIIQSTIEWKGRLDIAEVEANAQKVEALAGSISESFKSTGDTIASLFGALATGDLGFSEKWAIEDAISSEIALRNKQQLNQEKLTEAEINLMNERARRLKDGGPEIQIAMDGIYPELEMIMWEVIKRVQVRANEDASEFLLGL